jgi:hypothetical protein
MRGVIVATLLALGCGRIGYELAEDDAATAGSTDAAEPTARVDDGLVALYRLDERTGSVLFDASGHGTPLDLVIETPSATTWTETGLRVDSPTLITSDTSASKITSACVATGELSVESWIVANSATGTAAIGPERIVTMSADRSHRNFTLGQGAADGDEYPHDVYSWRVRTTETSLNGVPGLQTPPGTTTADLIHLVATAAAPGDSVLYLDGEEVTRAPLVGDFSNWGDFPLALAEELTQERSYLGEYRLVAIYCRELTASEIAQNFAAGP